MYRTFPIFSDKRRRPEAAANPVALSRFAAILVIAALGDTSRQAMAQHQNQRQQVRNVVYTESNNPQGNAIFAFAC